MVLFTSKSIVVNWLPSYYSFVLYVILMISFSCILSTPSLKPRKLPWIHKMRRGH